MFDLYADQRVGSPNGEFSWDQNSWAFEYSEDTLTLRRPPPPKRTYTLDWGPEK